MSERKPMWWWRRMHTETAMQRAFLIALTNWAARSVHNNQIVIPTGRVNPVELVRVVTALKCAGTNRHHRPALGSAGIKAALNNGGPLGQKS